MVTTWDVLKYLMKHDVDAELFRLLAEHKQSFSSLKEEFDPDCGNSTITRALGRLSKKGLVYHSFEERSNSDPRVYSYYEATPIGKKILKLYDEMEARAKKQPVS